MAVTIIDVGYRSTHYWVVSEGRSRILVDLGWPGTMGQMAANLKRAGVSLSEVQYGLATHYHPDHAGLAQELKLAGVPLIVVDVQIPWVPLLNTIVKPVDKYVDVTMHDNVEVTCATSRALLKRIGINGTIVHTPGHSDDSVSLLLADGSVFTGDLTPPRLATDETVDQVMRSWRRLKDLGATRVYPGHGPVSPMPDGLGAADRRSST